jgi:excisionase family DNA binding protein
MSGTTIEVVEPRLQRERYRVSEISAMLGVSTQRVAQMLAEGRLPHYREGRAVYIPRQAWEQYLADRNAEAEASIRVK